jgi:phage terminase large subunit
LSTLRIPTAKIFEPLLQRARYKGAYGGRGSGKSHFFGELLVETCQAERGTSAVCIREAQRTLAQSSKRLIERKIAVLGLGHRFRIYSDKIATPGDGIIIFRGMQHHTADSIKSLEGFRIAWVDEAQNLSARSLSLLRPTIRAEGSELWASWNIHGRGRTRSTGASRSDETALDAIRSCSEAIANIALLELDLKSRGADFGADRTSRG